MIMTVLEAQVAKDRWQALRDIYNQTIARLDPGLVQTYLAQDADDPSVWRIMTIWRDREALRAVRASGQTPAGLVMFRAAGAEPSLRVFEIAAAASA